MSLCLGGCGKPVPDGQKCEKCAYQAVQEWLERRKATQRK